MGILSVLFFVYIILSVISVLHVVKSLWEGDGGYKWNVMMTIASLVMTPVIVPVLILFMIWNRWEDNE